LPKPVGASRRTADRPLRTQPASSEAASRWPWRGAANAGRNLRWSSRVPRAQPQLEELGDPLQLRVEQPLVRRAQARPSARGRCPPRQRPARSPRRRPAQRRVRRRLHEVGRDSPPCSSASSAGQRPAHGLYLAQDRAPAAAAHDLVDPAREQRHGPARAARARPRPPPRSRRRAPSGERPAPGARRASSVPSCARQSPPVPAGRALSGPIEKSERSPTLSCYAPLVQVEPHGIDDLGAGPEVGSRASAVSGRRGPALVVLLAPGGGRAPPPRPRGPPRTARSATPASPGTPRRARTRTGSSGARCPAGLPAPKASSAARSSCATASAGSPRARGCARSPRPAPRRTAARRSFLPIAARLRAR
jgi:hypothetical protein